MWNKFCEWWKSFTDLESIEEPMQAVFFTKEDADNVRKVLENVEEACGLLDRVKQQSDRIVELHTEIRELTIKNGALVDELEKQKRETYHVQTSYEALDKKYTYIVNCYNELSEKGNPDLQARIQLLVDEVDRLNCENDGLQEDLRWERNQKGKYQKEIETIKAKLKKAKAKKK